MNRSFADLGLPPSLLASLTAEGITVPFPIQAATLPDTLAGHEHPARRNHVGLLRKIAGGSHSPRGKVAAQPRAGEAAPCGCGL